MTEIDPAELLTDHDIKILGELSMSIFDIWSEEIQKKKRGIVYDNKTLDDFMSEFTIMVDSLIREKNIKDYISHIHGNYLTIEVPVRRS
jgi:hypothetical protein